MVNFEQCKKKDQWSVGPERFFPGNFLLEPNAVYTGGDDMETKSFHLPLPSDNRLPIAGALAFLLDEQLPEVSFFMASFGKRSDGSYMFT